MKEFASRIHCSHTVEREREAEKEKGGSQIAKTTGQYYYRHWVSISFGVVRAVENADRLASWSAVTTNK